MSIQVLMASPTQTQRMIRLVRELGYEPVERFPSGSDLLAKVPTAPIELILAGKDLPDMSGSALTGQIRVREIEEGNLYIPVILVGTGFSEAEKKTTIRSGVTQLLSEPFTKKRLAETLAIALEWQR